MSNRKTNGTLQPSAYRKKKRLPPSLIAHMEQRKLIKSAQEASTPEAVVASSSNNESGK